MESQTKKITITFDLKKEDERAQWEKIESIQRSSTPVKKLKSSDIIRACIRNLSEREILEIQKQSLGDEERLEIWKETYNKKNNTSLSMSEFFVKAMPKLKEKDLADLENIFFSAKITKPEGGQNVSIS